MKGLEHMHKTTSQKQGFTIIEVVLVLAIAGLIFLIVFLALPALQRSQRDTQRRSDLARFLSQLTQYESNKQGSLPGTTAAQWNTNLVTPYLTSNGQTFNDPSVGATYTLAVTSVIPAAGTAPTFTPNPGSMNVYIGGSCNSANASGVQAASARNVAVLVAIEQGSFTCQDN
jgi:prepilin-type N-terminal cleavage/methylation domain-containing protein